MINTRTLKDILDTLTEEELELPLLMFAEKENLILYPARIKTVDIQSGRHYTLVSVCLDS